MGSGTGVAALFGQFCYGFIEYQLKLRYGVPNQDIFYDFQVGNHSFGLQGAG